MMIIRAELADLQQILTLQYLAYQSEAQLVNDYSIQPLTQTLEEIKQEYQKGIILKAVDDDGNIVGSVRGHADTNTCFIGKLIVHPNDQGQGIGTQLLIEIEKACPRLRYELFTSSRSIRNIRLYESVGYHKYKEQSISLGITMIYLEKCEVKRCFEHLK